MKKRKPKFRGFRRKHWFVGNPLIRDAHDGTYPLTRTWREGEPVNVHSHSRMHRP